MAVTSAVALTECEEEEEEEEEKKRKRNESPFGQWKMIMLNDPPTGIVTASTVRAVKNQFESLLQIRLIGHQRHSKSI